jgi:hypothetical protein
MTPNILYAQREFSHDPPLVLLMISKENKVLKMVVWGG